MGGRGVPGTGFWNGASTLKQYFVLPKIGSKYYLKYSFLAFPVLGVLGLGTPLMARPASGSGVQGETEDMVGPITPKAKLV